MDINTSASCSQRPKLNEERNMDEGSKILGNLPETILQHIISFLPTKDAVGTCIVSKRWRYLWTSIPNLEFKEGPPFKRKLFLDFVERVLVLRDFSPIKMFSLSCDVWYDASRISTWISEAARRYPQKLYVRLYNSKEPFDLPHCLFTCKTLTFLELDLLCILKLPSSICLSNLTNLYLVNVIFFDDYTTQQLLSGPVLEKLFIHECSWTNLKAVKIFAPKLQSLTINETYMLGEGDLDHCQVMIFGVTLKSFHYSGQLLNEYCFCNSSSLVEASIDVSYFAENARPVAYRVNKLLQGLSNVKNLTLSFEAVKVLTHAAELFADLPVFSNMIKLVLDVGFIDVNCRALLKILQNAPCLTYLVFDEGIGLSPNCVKDERMLESAPSCFLYNLKGITIREFDGNEEELFVVKILLSSAAVLEWMIISFSQRFARSLAKHKKEVLQHLLDLPRRSKSCEIDFV